MTLHLSDKDIVKACADPDMALNALVVDILMGEHGHTDLVELVFRMGEVIERLTAEAAE